MAITTWLHSYEIGSCLDKDIQELLDTIYSETNEKWVVLPYNSSIRRKFLEYICALNMIPKTYYSLYKHLWDTEYQVMNFYLELSGTSINTIVPKEIIMAYLYGLLGRKHG